MSMTLEQAFSRLKWRVSSLNNNKLDLEAINTVIDHINLIERQTVNDHHLFSKLFIATFISLAQKKNMAATAILREIEEILQTPNKQLLELFEMEMPFFKFELIVHEGCQGLDPIKDYDKIKKIRLKNMRANQAALTGALRSSWDVDKAEAFFKEQITKCIKTYS